MKTSSKKRQDDTWGYTRTIIRLFKVGKYYQWIGNEGGKGDEPLSPLFLSPEAAYYYSLVIANKVALCWRTDDELKESYPLPKATLPISKYKPIRKPPPKKGQPMSAPLTRKEIKKITTYAPKVHDPLEMSGLVAHIVTYPQTLKRIPESWKHPFKTVYPKK
jgi:hypothetical protein